MNQRRIDRIEGTLTSQYHLHIMREPRLTPSTTLRDLLTLLFPHIAVDAWPSHLEWGGIYLNGKRMRHDEPIQFPCKLEFYEPRYALGTAAALFPQWDPAWIQYQDEHFVVIYKPAGLPTQPGKEQIHFHLRGYVERFLERPVHFPSRLDMSTAGLVIGSLTPATHGPLQRLFERRTIKKSYFLLVEGVPKWHSYECTLPIGRSSLHPILREPHGAESKESHTEFMYVSSGADATSIWLAHPQTGRTHQLRVHAAALGHPIVGDNFYEGRRAPELALVCAALAFSHPVQKVPVTVMLSPSLFPSWLSLQHIEALNLAQVSINS